MAKYTEGEWKLSEKDSGGYGGDSVIADGFTGSIATVNMDCYKFQANANLITAAPDMYEALKFFMKELAKDYEYLDKGIGIATERGKSMLNARKAIAKAEGQN